MFPNKDVVSLSIKASVGEVTPVMPFEVCDEQVFGMSFVRFQSSLLFFESIKTG